MIHPPSAQPWLLACLALSIPASLVAQDPAPGFAPTKAPSLIRTDASNEEPRAPRLESTQVAQADPAWLQSVTPIHTAEPDPVGGAYGTWAAGSRYKVSFHGIPTFFPYLGKDYPVTRQLGWETASIRRDGIEYARRTPDQAKRSDTRFEYDHGRVIEAYDVLAEGLEQTFVLATPLEGSGDLEIVGALHSNLELRETQGTPATVTFVDDQGTPILTYGEALVFDAAGRQTFIQTTASGQEIRLTVDGNWLDQATYPVVVDPLTSVTTLALGASLGSLDTVRDDQGNDPYLAYTRFSATGDGDLYIRAVQDDFTGNTTIYTDITTDWNTRAPQIAATDFPVKTLTVFERRFPTGSSFLRYHVHDSGDFTLSTTTSFLSNPSGMQSWRPDVGGTTQGNSDYFLVVFQQDAGTTLTNTATSMIGGRVINVSGTSPSPGSPFVFLQGGNIDAERPSINQMATPNGLATTWIAVSQQYNNGIPGDDWDCVARQVTAAGSISAFTWVPLDAAAVPTSHRLAPQIAGRDGRYGVSYGRSLRSDVDFKTLLNRSHAIDFERFDWPDGSGTVTKYPAVEQWPYIVRRWETASCAFDHESASHWAFTCRSNRDFGGTGNVYACRVGYTGGQLERVPTFPPTGTDQAVPGGVTYDRDGDEMIVAFGNNGPAGSFSDRATLARFEYPTPPGPVLSAGTACGAGNLIWLPLANGSQQIGSEFNLVQVVNTTPTTLHLMALSLATANQPLVAPGVEPGCNLLVSLNAGFVGLYPAAIGQDVLFPIPLPESLPSTTLYFQDFHTNPAGTRFQTTRRLEVPVVR